MLLETPKHEQKEEEEAAAAASGFGAGTVKPDKRFLKGRLSALVTQCLLTDCGEQTQHTTRRFRPKLVGQEPSRRNSVSLLFLYFLSMLALS